MPKARNTTRSAEHMPDGWQMVRLGDAAEVVGGSTPPRTQGEYWGGDIPWVVPSELTGLSSRYLSSTNESITATGMLAAGLRVIPAASVLLTSRATIGVTAINAVPVTTNQGFQSLVPRCGTDGLWLYYWTASMRHELERRGSGSTFREVSRGDVRGLPLLLPPIAEQRRIASVLDAIDNAIERTDDVIAATEHLRDVLLQGLLSHGVPGWHSEWRDVPGLGTIPADWEVVQLGCVCEPIKDGDWIESRDQGGHDYRLLQLSNVGTGEFIETGTSRWITRATFRRLNCTEVHLEDVLVARMPDPVGRALYISELTSPTITAVDVAIVRTNGDILLPQYLAHNLNSARNLNAMRSLATGTTRKRIRRSDIATRRIALPPLEEQQIIVDTLNGVQRAINRGRDARDELQVLKASTADALLSGRVRVG